LDLGFDVVDGVRLRGFRLKGDPKKAEKNLTGSVVASKPDNAAVKVLALTLLMVSEDFG
jgi:hypothetical protein